MNVTIYKQRICKAAMMTECGTFYALKPYENAGSPYYDGATLSENAYELPAGLQLGKDMAGMIHIYDKKGRIWEIIGETHPIITNFEKNISLKKVTQDQQK